MSPAKSAKNRGKALVVIVVLAVVAAGVGYLYLRNNTVSKPFVPVFTAQNPKDLTQAHNAFGFNVLKGLAQEDVGSNVFISPTSISLDLSMVYNGASGKTKTAIANTLQLQNLDINEVNQKSHDLSALLKNPDPDVELDIANSVWAKQGLNFQPDFLTTVKNNYSAEISTLDFSNPDSVNTINDWVNNNTNGKIPTIITSIPPQMVMYLINAVYFKGNWSNAFDPSLTKNKPFTPANGGSVMRPFMQQSGYIQYLETNDFQSVSLPYGKSGRFSMDIFLPKNLSDFTNSLNIDNWNSWLQQYQWKKGTLLLPRFKLDYQTSLIKSLTKLGMGVAFTDDADFGLESSQTDIKIGEVVHKTYLDVNEKGTEAAAVTGVLEEGLGLEVNPPKPFYMEVNRPFFIAIRDNQTQELLFIGTIQQP